MSEKNFKNINKSGSSNLAPTFVNHQVLSNINFNGHYLIKNNIFISKKVISLYISYILNPWLRNLNIDFILNICLFGSVKLTKNADLDKNKYRRSGIGFDSRSEVSLTDGRLGKTVTIFGADISSSVHIDNENKDILILGEGPTQGLEDTTLTVEAKFPISFTQSEKKICIKFTL